jgi:putative hydrolase of the HAD superfamily
MARSSVTTVGFDADDTLWQNERWFRDAEDRFLELLSDHAEPECLAERLLATEKRNVGIYGFGIKGFMLSMIETALDVSERRLPASVIDEILGLGRAMLAHPVELLPNARATLEALAGHFRLILVTKGDLADQERKIAQSGVAELFDAVEIVSDKTAGTYARVFDVHGDGPDRGLMVGNSLRSDILPALEAGAFAVHVPHELTWSFEKAVDAPDPDHPRLRTASDIAEVVAILEELCRN